MSKVYKYTEGYVTQVYDTLKNKWVSQKFTAGVEADWEDELENTIEFGFALDRKNPYLSFDMLPPSLLENLILQREQLQEDIKCILDEVEYTLDNGQKMIDNICQVVCDRLNSIIEKIDGSSNQNN